MKKIFQKIKIENKETLLFSFKSRFFIIFLTLILVWCLILFKAFRIHILPNQKIETFYQSQFHKKITLNPRRGTIYDRNQRELAVSTPSFSLYADPKEITSNRKMALYLSRILKTSAFQIQKKLKNKNRRSVLIQRHLNQALKNKIEASKKKGLYFKENLLRVYPNGNFLSQVLGFIGSEGNGLEGLELAYNEILKGKKKQIFVQRDAYNRPLISKEKNLLESPKGFNIYLTIDSEFQFILEKELNVALETLQADSAMGLILQAQTAEILALANLPSFDLNTPLHSKSDHRRNRVLTDTLEPGSIMKIFTIASALKKKRIKEDEKLDCEEGKWKIGGHTIHEADSKSHFKFLNPAQILAFSSNIGSSKIALRLGDSALREELRNFGFGMKTGIQFPGEVKGILRKLPWKPHLLSTISFGHGISATPLQVARAFTAFTNNGWILNPYLVKAIENPETKERTNFKKETFKRVLDFKEALQMKKMLKRSTAKNSTGFRAKPFGFEVAGKTSTAQKFNPKKGGYFKKAHVSSFIGMIPVKDPQFIIYLIIDHPKTKYYASTVVAPLFSKIAGFVARKSGLTPQFKKSKDSLLFKNLSSMKKNSPSIEKAYKNPQLTKVFSHKKPPSEKKREDQKGNTGKAQIPLKRKNLKLEYIPNLKGLTLREVLKKFKNQKIKLIVQGEGKVVQTLPKPGRKISKNQKIKIWLK